MGGKSTPNIMTSEDYIKEQAEKIISDMGDNLSWSVSTCDYSNWDRELHRYFPCIAKYLREKGFRVTSSVNWGVTDWVIVREPKL